MGDSVRISFGLGDLGTLVGVALLAVVLVAGLLVFGLSRLSRWGADRG